MAIVYVPSYTNGLSYTGSHPDTVTKSHVVPTGSLVVAHHARVNKSPFASLPTFISGVVRVCDTHVHPLIVGEVRVLFVSVPAHVGVT